LACLYTFCTNQGNTKITANFDEESTFDIVEYEDIQLSYIESCIEIFKDFDKSIGKWVKTRSLIESKARVSSNAFCLWS
jgi:hypothetical protein